MDFINELQRFLRQMGFRLLENEEKILWIKEEYNQVKLLEIVPELLPGQSRHLVKNQQDELAQLGNHMMIRFQKKVDFLTVMIFKDLPEEQIIEELNPYPDIWCLDRKNGRLFIYENQRTDYDNLRDPLETFLASYRKHEVMEEKKDFQIIFQPVNTGIVIANILVFVILSLMGNVTDATFMAEHGALDLRYVMEKEQYYRLFTAMFLHFGADHLLQNMLILLLIGSRLERIVGKGKYLFIYLGAGLGSSLSSLFITLAREPYTVAAGASGAIFGVMGGLLFLILKDMIQGKRKRMKEIGLTGIIFMIVSALSYGFATTGVDNAAHVGGLIAGFILTGLLTIRE